MCESCKNSGWITATHKQTGAVYAFRCHCPTPDKMNLSKHIASWHPRNSISMTVDNGSKYNLATQPVTKPDMRQRTADQGKDSFALDDEAPF